MAINREAGDDGVARNAGVAARNGIERSPAESAHRPSADHAREPAAKNPGTGRARHVSASVLRVLAAVLFFAAVPAVYLDNEVLDADRYSAIVEPLASDPAVQMEIADRVSAQITDAVDIGSITRDALTELGQAAPRVAAVIAGFGPAIAEETTSLVQTTVSKYVAGPEFRDLWMQANRAAHEAIVSSASGNTGGAVSIDNSGTVTISTKEIITRVKTLLTEQGITVAARIPELDGQITLFQSAGLARATEAIRIVDRAAPVLGWLAGLSALGAIIVAPRGWRVRMTGGVGLAIAVAMAGLAVALAIGRDMALGSNSTSTVSFAAAQSIADAFLDPLRTDMRFVAVTGLLIAASAFLAGRSQTAEPRRGGNGRAAGDLNGKPAAGQRRPWQHGLAQFRLPLEAAITGAAVLVLVLWQHPSSAAASWTVVLAGLAILLIELLSRQTVQAIVH